MELHPQVRAIVEAAAAEAGEEVPPDLEALRASYLDTALRLGGAAEPVAAVEEIVIPRDDGGRLRAKSYRPQVPAQPLGALVWLHGGGWVVGDLAGFDHVARALANASGAVVVTVEYRLAPEDRFPAALRDARAGVAWALRDGGAQLGTEAGLVAVGGDSAGGNLAAAAALHARELRAQLLVYPALDARMDSDSYRELAEDPVLPARYMARCWEAYLGGSDGEDPDASPLLAADLGGAPPAFVAVARDVLRDDGLRYAEALRAAAVPVELQDYGDMVHGFLRWGGVADRARELIDALGAFARARLSG
ncbi:MAG TPA: alpha/beta hydrolase [Solirubrobacteraceae bacterium]|nr:alpha/beta hydrolase [Solirubrobacteraceae bacterium]